MVASPKPSTADTRIHPDDVFMVSCSIPIILFSCTIKMQSSRQEWARWLVAEKQRHIKDSGKVPGKKHKSEIDSTETRTSHRFRLMSEYKSETEATLREMAMEASILKSMAVSNKAYIEKYNVTTENLQGALEADTRVTELYRNAKVKALDDMNSTLKIAAQHEMQSQKALDLVASSTNSSSKGKALMDLYHHEIAKRDSMSKFVMARSRQFTDVVLLPDDFKSPLPP